MLYEKEGMNSSKKRSPIQNQNCTKNRWAQQNLSRHDSFFEIAFEMKLELVLRSGGSPRAKKAAARSKLSNFSYYRIDFFSHRGFLFWKKERRRKDTFRSSPSLSSHPLFPIYRNGNKIGICNTICIILCKNLCIKSSKRVCQSTSVFSTIFWQFQV